ncbi:porin [Algoriphagus confluentis]|uniref:Porin n=1 Tax=Algoriphagus confluentis TaxID=1697556 RepID=A0ABQ6PSN1_9BACT|nr:porin [Algoriphagus confluentis]
MRQWVIILALLGIPGMAFSQDFSTPDPLFNFSGFLNLYYGYDFNEPTTLKRLPFLYNHARHNTPAVNLALLNVAFRSGRFRANLGIQQGTYSRDNYANEPEALRWIHQANLGFALNPDQTLWLEAGVLPSHIGFESAISKDHLTPSRSLIAENSPYFETGFKLGWQANEQWFFALLYLNGWQRIKPIEGVNKPSFGTQITYTPLATLTLNWSTFLGTDAGIEAGTMIFFSNMYGVFAPRENWKLIAGLDVGNRVNEFSSNQSWWGASFIAQFSFSEKLRAAIRGEYFHDPLQGIAFSFYDTGLQAGGLSLNVDRNIRNWGLVRLEARYLDSPHPFYQKIPDPKTENLFIMGTFSLFWGQSSSRRER